MGENNNVNIVYAGESNSLKSPCFVWRFFDRIYNIDNYVAISAWPGFDLL